MIPLAADALSQLLESGGPAAVYGAGIGGLLGFGYHFAADEGDLLDLIGKGALIGAVLAFFVFGATGAG